MGFEVINSFNESYSEIETKLHMLSTVAADLSMRNAYSIMFIYYSGHGASNGGVTYGYSTKGEPIPVETFSKTLAKIPLTNVSSFIDCCRIEEKMKGP